MDEPPLLASHFKGIKVNRHIAVVAVMVAGVAFLHYADEIPPIAMALSRVGYPLTRHAMQRILFLIPIGYATLQLGLIGGTITVLVSALIMMPRVLFISPTPLDALSEVGVTAFAGGALAWLIDKLGKERLERERTALRLQAAAEVTDLVSRSLDLQQVLQETLDAIVGRLEVGPRGGIFLLDEETQLLRLCVQHGLSSEFVAQEATVAIGECLCGLAAKSGEVIWSASCPDDPRHARQGEPSPHFHLVIPLKAREKVFGVAFFYPRRAVDDEEIELFVTIGEQIGMAIENTRLYEQTDAKLAKRIRDLALLMDIADITSQSLELDDMLNACLDIILGFWQAGKPSVHLLNEKTGMWDLVCHRGLSTELIEYIKEVPLTRGFLGKVAATGEAYFTTSIANYEPEARQMIERCGYNLPAFVPLKSRNRLLGCLTLSPERPGGFTTEDLQALILVGNEIASGIERIMLYGELQRLGALEERDRIARELHDGLAQSLGCLNLQCLRVADLLSSNRPDQAREELEQVRRGVKEAYEDVREGIFALRLAASKEKGFIPSILAYLREFEAQSGTEAQLVIDSNGAGRLSPATELQLIRIIQEALTNVRKHTTASKTVIRIESLGEEAKITIEDDGQGFDLDTLDEESVRHFGLEFMRERAESVGGTLEIETKPGEGTKVIVKVPLAEEERWWRPHP